MKIKVGSRDSLLAITQTNLIIDSIKNFYPNIEFEIIPIKTKGDKILDVSLDKIGGKGLFINELEVALANNNIDMAVHSMKDIPINLGKDLIISAYFKREDSRDVFISNKYNSLKDMPTNSILGTSSLRRQVQTLNINPNLNIKLLRGNVITRINKLEMNEYDGIILAMAGIKRLGLENKIKYIFSIDEIVPAVCQGILGVETHKDNLLNEILTCIDDKEARLCATIERTFMKTICGSCTTPMGAYAEVNNNQINITGFYSLKENIIIKKSINGNLNEGDNLAIKLANYCKGENL